MGKHLREGREAVADVDVHRIDGVKCFEHDEVSVSDAVRAAELSWCRFTLGTVLLHSGSECSNICTFLDLHPAVDLSRLASCRVGAFRDGLCALGRSFFGKPERRELVDLGLFSFRERHFGVCVGVCVCCFLGGCRVSVCLSFTLSVCVVASEKKLSTSKINFAFCVVYFIYVRVQSRPSSSSSVLKFTKKEYYTKCVCLSLFLEANNTGISRK